MTRIKRTDIGEVIVTVFLALVLIAAMIRAYHLYMAGP